MRVIQLVEPGGPENLVVGEAPMPVLGAGEVLIKVRASGLNRADVLQRKGFYPPPPGASDVIGLEVSGTVEALGEGVTGWSSGDQCVALLAGGGYAEYVAVPVGQVLRPPAGIDLVTAAGLIEVAATVVSNFDRAALAAGETILIHGGAGGIGTFAIQYAKALGARVIVTAGTAEKLELCRSLGAELALDYHDDWAAAMKEHTGGRGVDVILDVMGASYLGANVTSLAMDGRLVIIGLQGGRKEPINLGMMLGKRLTLITTSLRSRPITQKAAICARVAEQVWPLIESGQVLPAPEARFAFVDAANAHRNLEQGDHVGKTLLVQD